jgi:hypothetical protein
MMVAYSHMGSQSLSAGVVGEGAIPGSNSCAGLRCGVETVTAGPCMLSAAAQGVALLGTT